MTDKHSLIDDLERLADSSKILDQLVRMAPARVERLLALLSDERSIQALRQLLETTRTLQAAGGVQRSLGRLPIEQRNGARHYPSSESVPEDIGSVLQELFSDRDQFPTVPSIAAFAAKVFKKKVSYNRNSRKAFIQKVIRAVEDDSRALKHARNALAHGSFGERDAAYSLLYRFIRGRGEE